MVDWTAKWASYAAAHEQYRRSYPGYELRRVGWEEISVNPTTDLESLFTPELTNLVCNFFQSEFAVLFRGGMERGPGEMDESALWHLDAGPAAHLRIIIPLVESDGGTAVISYTDDVDYAPVDVRDRLADLSGCKGYNGAWVVSPSVGEALIFQPTRVLHRAVPPKSGVRKVFQVGLIPWGEPWQEFEKEHRKDNANSFPSYEIIND